jgi:UDP-glucose 4-epimerase
MNILITGGCGFVGVNLIAYIQKNTTDHIVVLDNLSVGKKEYLSEFNVDFIHGDICDLKIVDRVISEVDAVIHLAADTRVIDSIQNPDFNFAVNVQSTYNLLSAARKHNIKRFVMASTGGAIIGDAVPPVHERMVPRPISPYGASKLCGEAYCSAFAGSYGMKTVSLRFSNVYGPRSYHKGSVIAHFFKQILEESPLIVYGDGQQARDFVYVEDLSEVIYKSVHLENANGVYQLGTEIETSINRLIELIKRTVGDRYSSIEVKFVPPRKGEILRNYADISRARSQLGFKPEVGLEEGLERTWAWFKVHKQAS